MLRHPVFANILLHADHELAEALGVGIAERETIHEWPLSCVQRLLHADGTKLIYKSQLPPTLEPLFYECASSPLLLGHQALGKLGDCDTMVIDWIDAPLLRTAACDEVALVAHGRQVIVQIGEIHGDLPIYLDIGSAEAWSAASDVVLKKLHTLVVDGRFGLMDLNVVERVQTWANSAGIAAIAAAHPRVIHGDLRADQIFVTADGYRVIDWQRPVIAPPEVDLVALLVGEHIEPRRFVDAATVRIFWFLRLYWAVEAQCDLFPEYRGRSYDQWAAEAITQILA